LVQMYKTVEVKVRAKIVAIAAKLKRSPEEVKAITADEWLDDDDDDVFAKLQARKRTPSNARLSLSGGNAGSRSSRSMAMTEQGSSTKTPQQRGAARKLAGATPQTSGRGLANANAPQTPQALQPDQPDGTPPARDRRSTRMLERQMQAPPPSEDLLAKQAEIDTLSSEVLELRTLLLQQKKARALGSVVNRLKSNQMAVSAADQPKFDVRKVLDLQEAPVATGTEIMQGIQDRAHPLMREAERAKEEEVRAQQSVFAEDGDEEIEPEDVDEELLLAQRRANTDMRTDFTQIIGAQMVSKMGAASAKEFAVANETVASRAAKVAQLKKAVNDIAANNRDWWGNTHEAAASWQKNPVPPSGPAPEEGGPLLGRSSQRP